MTKVAEQKQQEAVVENKATEPAEETTVQSDWMTFAEAAKELGVRFQQVYQRAVVRGKMRWEDRGKHKVVARADVAEWAKVREAYFSTKTEA